MERDEAQQIARAYRSTSNAVLAASELGVDDGDMHDFMHARNLGVVQAVGYDYKPSMNTMAGIYHLCGENTDELLDFMEEAQEEVQNELDSWIEDMSGDDENTFWLDGKEVRSSAKLSLSFAVATKFDDYFESEASKMAFEEGHANIDECKRALYKQFGLTDYIKMTPSSERRLKRQLTTNAFADMLGAKDGSPRDLDLTPAAQFIETQPGSARYYANKFDLRNQEFRVFAGLITDPEFDLASVGEQRWAYDSPVDHEDFDYDTKMFSLYTDLLAKDTIHSQVATVSKLLALRHRWDEESDLFNEQNLMDESKDLFRDYRTFVTDEWRDLLADMEGQTGDHKAEVFKERIQEAGSLWILNKFNGELLTNIILGYASADSSEIGYEEVLQHMGFKLPDFFYEEVDSDVRYREYLSNDWSKSSPERTSLGELWVIHDRWTKAVANKKTQAEQLGDYYLALAGKDNSEESLDD